MDLEILELVNKALEALENGKSNDAYFILKDAVSIYDERFADEFATHSDPMGWQEKLARREAMSHPTDTVDEQLDAVSLNAIFGGDPVAQLSDIIARTTGKE